MKKLNNKGFAISIILYSISAIIIAVLLLIIAVEATRVHNASNMANDIKEELSKGKSYEATVETSTYEATNVGHQHTGDSSSGGGCYTNKKTGSTSKQCAGYTGYSWESGGKWYVTCTTCGHYWEVSGSGIGYQKCPKTTTSSYTYYELGCGQEETTEYSCPDGGKLAGTTCVLTTYTCPNGGTLNGTICEY